MLTEMTLHYNEVHKCLVLVYPLDANTPMHCVYVTMYVEFRKLSLLIISQQVFRQCHTNKKLIQNTPITNNWAQNQVNVRYKRRNSL